MRALLLGTITLSLTPSKDKALPILPAGQRGPFRSVRVFRLPDDSAVTSQEHPGRPRGRVLAGNAIDALARNYPDQAPGDIGVSFVNPPKRSLRIAGRDIAQGAAGPTAFSGAGRGRRLEVGELS